MPPSPEKAREMLQNPPHGKPLSKDQKHYFQAIEHGWHPSGRPSMKHLKERGKAKR